MEHNENPDTCWKHGCPIHVAPEWIQELVKIANPFNELVNRELSFARNKFPNMNSLHEGYAVILEELDELWEWIKQKQVPELTEENHRNLVYMYPTRNQAEICKELVQIAAMAQRLFEDVASDGNKVHK